MNYNNFVDKLKPYWLSFIIASIILATEQVLAVLWAVWYLNLDVQNGDTTQMAIQMFNWMNSDINIFSRLFRLSQDIGNLVIPLFLIGVCLYFLNRERKVDDACIKEKE